MIVKSSWSAGTPSAIATSQLMITTSWQRPTALIDVSLLMARVRHVIGFVRFSSHASGHSSSMSRAMSSSTGMLRSDRLMPPGPHVSPTDWRTP